jgi:hypothetical protein
MYGSLPADDEAEIVLFGPGYGEAIVVHLGYKSWILVDSCINPDNKLPASLHYLRELGVQASEVKAVVASHWHDDHVRGLAVLADAYPTAEFFLSAVFNQDEAKGFLAAYGSEIAAPQARGAQELFKIAKARKNIIFTQHRVVVLELPVGARTIRVLALSPTAAAQSQALAHFASYLPTTSDKPITHAPEIKPNLEAIVLHVDFGDDAILLGSDLENSGALGWAEVLADQVCGSRRRSAFFKVAHHGSNTGDLPAIWTNLLSANPIAALTPFNNGSVHLPTSSDRVRIKANAASAYITSNATKKPQISRELEKRMQDFCTNLSPVNGGFGALRFRKKLGRQTWNVEMFGRATTL